MFRSTHPVQSPRWFGSKEVALILNTDEWRVRNFGSKLYGLSAEIKSPGSGNRKRYFFEVVLKMAVADELYNAQISPVGIKAALKLVKDRKLVEKWVASYGSSESVPEMVLALDSRTVVSQQDGQEATRIERMWTVLESDPAAKLAQRCHELGSVTISTALLPLWESVVQRITQLEGEGAI